MGDVVHRRRDVVDGDDVRVPQLRAQQREPLRQEVAQALDRLEEVVGAVDLVHLAGARVADDDRRAVDPPRARELLAGDLLGLELRAVVGRGQLLALVEHVLAVQALVQAGGGNRGGVVEDPRVDRVGQLDRVAGARDVELLVLLVLRGHVVHGRQVEEEVEVEHQAAQEGQQRQAAERLRPLGQAERQIEPAGDGEELHRRHPGIAHQQEGSAVRPGGEQAQGRRRGRGRRPVRTAARSPGSRRRTGPSPLKANGPLAGARSGRSEGRGARGSFVSRPARPPSPGR